MNKTIHLDMPLWLLIQNKKRANQTNTTQIINTEVVAKTSNPRKDNMFLVAQKFNLTRTELDNVFDSGFDLNNPPHCVLAFWLLSWSVEKSIKEKYELLNLSYKEMVIAYSKTFIPKVAA
jgi:hypothetical protein